MAFTIGLASLEEKKKLLLANFFGKNEEEEEEEEEVGGEKEEEEEGAYYARTILTKVSHRAPLGRRPNHRATLREPRAHAAVAFRTYTYVGR